MVSRRGSAKSTEAHVIHEVLGDLYRDYRMPGFWRLRDTCGASIYEIADAIRNSTGDVYPCLWINRYAWAVNPEYDAKGEPLSEAAKRTTRARWSRVQQVRTAGIVAS